MSDGFQFEKALEISRSALDGEIGVLQAARALFGLTQGGIASAGSTSHSLIRQVLRAPYERFHPKVGRPGIPLLSSRETTVPAN